MIRNALAIVLALSFNPAIAEPIKLTCEYVDPNSGTDEKLQFTIDPVKARLANSAVSELPTIRAFQVTDDFWFFHTKVEREGEFKSSTVVLNRHGQFWVAVFVDNPGAEFDGAKVISGNCLPILGQ